MTRKPTYYFDSKDDTGINGVILGSVVTVNDYNGDVKIFMYKNNTGVGSTTTVEQAVGASNLEEILKSGQVDAGYVAVSDYEDLDVLAKIKNVDGAGSGLDADTLDGMNSDEFVAVAGDTMTGMLTVNSGSRKTLSLGYADYSDIEFKTNSSQIGTFYATHLDSESQGGGYSFHFKSTESTTNVIVEGGNFYSGSNKVWHQGNDGAGSGLDADKLDGLNSGEFYRTIGTASANVGPGWMTIARNTSGRHHGEVIVTDADSGDHAFIRIDWMRSYQDSNVSVNNVGGHTNRITGVRVLYDTGDNTYGEKILQVYVTAQSTYTVEVKQLTNNTGWVGHTVSTPVIENTKTDYAVHGRELTGLDATTLAAEEGIKAGGNIYAMENMYVGRNGGGDSRIYFYDDNNNTWRTFFWDDSANDWYVEDNGGTNRRMLHSGNAYGQLDGRYVNQAGDTMTGVLKTNNNVPIGIGTTPGGNLGGHDALALGDSDTGLRQNGDGVLEFFANDTEVFQITSGALDFYKNLDMNTHEIQNATINGGTY